MLRLLKGGEFIGFVGFSSSLRSSENPITPKRERIVERDYGSHWVGTFVGHENCMQCLSLFETAKEDDSRVITC